MRDKLTYLASRTLEDLYHDIHVNIERYRSGDFQDLLAKGNWSIQLSVEVDLDPLSELDPSGGSEVEVENSLRVWKALHQMTPALACEDRIWTRLTHVECLEYSRNRWIKGIDDTSDERDIRTHFFAPTRTGCRDDHAIARLWWNAKIAKDLAPTDQKGALEMILKTADIRSNLVERSWTLSRNKLGAAIISRMKTEPWVTQTESNFRDFMKTVNHLGGGIAFEMQGDTKLDGFLSRCVSVAGGPVAETASTDT